MIITVSGRRVKRPGKLIGGGLFGRGQLVKTPQIVRSLVRAKSRTCWAYRLTSSGQEAMTEAETFERRQSAYHALGLHALADVREIRRGYSVSLREICGVRLVCFQGSSCRDSVAVQVTGDTDNPFDCCEMGREVRLPNVSFELAAQLFMAARAEQEATHVS